MAVAQLPPPMMAIELHWNIRDGSVSVPLPVSCLRCVALPGMALSVFQRGVVLCGGLSRGSVWRMCRFFKALAKRECRCGVLPWLLRFLFAMVHDVALCLCLVYVCLEFVNLRVVHSELVFLVHAAYIHLQFLCLDVLDVADEIVSGFVEERHPLFAHSYRRPFGC